MSQEQLDNALQHGSVRINTGHSLFAGPVAWQKPRRTWSAANVFGAGAGVVGGCVGGAAALTATLPSTALWTSAVVCGGPTS